VGKTSNTSGGPTTHQKSPKKNFRAPPAENKGPILPQKNFHGADREGATHSQKKLRRQNPEDVQRGSGVQGGVLA